MKQIVSFPTSKLLRIHTEKLDGLMKQLTLRNADIFMKLDVEGHELEVLEGASNTIKRVNSFTLLGEDCAEATSDKLLRYLGKHGRLLTNLSTYNSFWNFR